MVESTTTSLLKRLATAVSCAAREKARFLPQKSIS
jgi:hypothetical protein